MIALRSTLFILSAAVLTAACEVPAGPDAGAGAEPSVAADDGLVEPSSTAAQGSEGYPGSGPSGAVEGGWTSETGPTGDGYPAPAGGSASRSNGSGRAGSMARFPIVLSAPQPDPSHLLTPEAGSGATAGDGGDVVGGPGADAAAGPGVTGPAAGCAGIVGHDGERLVLDGEPLTFFGINAHFALEDDFPEARVEPMVADLAARGVGVVRVWFLHDRDPERFERLLDVGRRHGVRFIVTLADNVFKGRDWFGGEEDEKRYRPHLERTVSRFGGRPEILFWELVNEPNCAGDFDEECLDTIGDWLIGRSQEVRAIDACHLVSTGMIGAGNHDFEHDEFRRIHRRDTIGIVSAHRRTNESREREIEIAEDLEKPVFFGEIYDNAFDEDCQPLDGGAELGRRAERVKDDLRDAMRDGVDGYVLWALAAGAVERPNGTIKHYCGPPDYELSDPVWTVLGREPGLLPSIPWRP